MHNLSTDLGVDIISIRRDKGVNILDGLVEKASFDDQSLKGLYDLVPSKKEADFPDDLLLHFKRSICSYLPEYLESYTKLEIKNVIVVEELSQIKAISKAKEINDHIEPFVYVDMPSLSGKNRMHRSPHGKIPIFSDPNSFQTNELFKAFMSRTDFPKINQLLETTDFISLIKKLGGYWNE